MMRVSPFSEHRTRFSAGKLGLGIFLASLTMLFAASLVGLLVIRIQTRQYWPELPSLPRGLWLSSAILAVSSATMQWALISVRAGRIDQLRIGLTITTMLGMGFLLVQFSCWLAWLQPVAQRWSNAGEVRYALTSFYVLTGLHALHVVGGLIPLSIVTRHAMHGVYSAAYHPGVQYCAMYWHFLGVVWVILYGTLLLTM